MSGQGEMQVTNDGATAAYQVRGIVAADDYVFAREMRLSDALVDPYGKNYFTERIVNAVKHDDYTISVVGAERLQPFYLHNLLGNPFDTAIAAAHLVFGGVLDRHPNLQVLLLHQNRILVHHYRNLRRRHPCL